MKHRRMLPLLATALVAGIPGVHLVGGPAEARAPAVQAGDGNTQPGKAATAQQQKAWRRYGTSGGGWRRPSYRLLNKPTPASIRRAARRRRNVRARSPMARKG